LCKFIDKMAVKHVQPTYVLGLVLCGNLLLCLKSHDIFTWVLQPVSVLNIFHSISVSVVDIFRYSGLQCELLKVESFLPWLGKTQSYYLSWHFSHSHYCLERIAQLSLTSPRKFNGSIIRVLVGRGLCLDTHFTVLFKGSLLFLLYWRWSIAIFLVTPTVNSIEYCYVLYVCGKV
jgi:hypothetical protein